MNTNIERHVYHKMKHKNNNGISGDDGIDQTSDIDDDDSINDDTGDISNND